MSKINMLIKVLFSPSRLSMSLKKRLLSAYNIDAVTAIQWGIQHESSALAKYKELGAEVEETGFIYLCYSRLLTPSERAPEKDRQTANGLPRHPARSDGTHSLTIKVKGACID